MCVCIFVWMYISVYICSVVHSPFGRVYRRRSFPGSTKRASFLLPAGRDTLMPSREQSTNRHENLANFQSRCDLPPRLEFFDCLYLIINCHDLDEFSNRLLKKESINSKMYSLPRNFEILFFFYIVLSRIFDS